ncbi:MAG TPA: Amuc_1098 family type IV pilus outer membrane protein [Terrimicrobiaceae bacterium]|nr:Amuc_1098 family type IV pilus outer membrane protein [Terrimicrobiaceae bacterium]
MKSQVLTAVIAAFLGLGVAVSPAQQAGVESAAEREIRRQESMADYAQKAVNKGTEAMMNQDYESAFSYFKSAVDVLPSGGPAAQELRATALDGFCRAAVKLSEQRISEGRYQDASTTVGVVLESRYAPDYGPALALQRKLKDPTRFNRAYTPGFIANVEEVKQLLLEADGFYASGRFDLAFKRYEQVLNIDKYNIAARRGMERVNVARQRYATTAYNEARGDMLAQVDKSWELPVRRFEVGASTIIEQPLIDTRGTSLINRKLDEIIIPRVDFRDATIREALDFLKQRAIALDITEQDPSRRGINIVLKVPPDSLEAEARITLSLNDIPLRAAIDYVAKAANLKLKIEPYAIAVVPQSEPTDVLITKEYKVPPGFITSLPASSQPPIPGPGSQTIAPGSQPAIQARSGAREFLEAQGVTFPPGASANFIASTSKLIIKNTQANLDLIDTLVETQMTAPPSQVEIESKFLEVTQNNLKEMGFDWLLGQFSMPFGTGVYGGGGTQGLGQNINANSFPLLNPGSTTVPIGASSATSGPITAGNRSGTTAISVNAVDSLLFATPFGPAPALLSVAGIFTNPQFQVVLRALNQQKGVDLVSAPKVTTKSGQRATIQIVREFRYPTEYDLPQVTQTPGSIYTPATPTTPTSFETKPVGITLEVEPTVGPDGYTIDLILSPRVVEFDGFINYGSPISTVVTLVPGGVAPNIFPSINAQFVVTQNVINKPVFSTREVTTEVTVYDGQTVVIGGLISENIQKTEDKVPILGDIPLAGRLFRTTADQHIKRNLIMFVTASLLDPAGQPLIKSTEEGEVLQEPSATGVEQEVIPGDAMTVPQPQ